MAILGPYNLGWETGVDKLLLISIGTGSSPEANAELSPNEMNLIYDASSLPSALMFDALNEQDILCRIFGDCLCGEQLDSEVGDLIDRYKTIHWQWIPSCLPMPATVRSFRAMVSIALG